MRLRTADLSDAGAIAATLREAFAPFESLYTPAGFLATTPTREQLTSRWAEGPVWVAERDGTIVGTVAAVPRPIELYVRSMAVRPGVQGQGVGLQLLQTAEAFAVEHGNSRLELSTTPFLLAALRLYERAGFRPTGEADLFGTPLIVLTKELRVPA